MTDSSKPIARPQTSSAAKKAQKKTVPEAKEQTIKLAISLNEGINDPLGTLIRYRRDRSTMPLEATDTMDLSRAALGAPNIIGAGHYHPSGAGPTRKVEENCR